MKAGCGDCWDNSLTLTKEKEFESREVEINIDSKKW